MDGLSVGGQDNSKETTFHLVNFHPASNAPVGLHLFPQRVVYRPLELFIENDGSVRALPDLEEVPGKSLVTTVPKTLASLAKTLNGFSSPAHKQRRSGDACSSGATDCWASLAHHLGLSHIDGQVSFWRLCADLKKHLTHPTTVISLVINHVKKHDAPLHLGGLPGCEVKSYAFGQAIRTLLLCPVTEPEVSLRLRAY